MISDWNTFQKTLWYYLAVKSPGEAVQRIIELYKLTLEAAILNKSNSNRIQEIIRSSKYPYILNALRFQNHQATSYYIKSATQTFEVNSQVLTKLSLTYGQDNMIIEDPSTNVVLGFLSAERKNPTRNQRHWVGQKRI